MNTQKGAIWATFSALSFLVSAIVLWLGLDKMLNYSNGESYPYKFHNAYVGGDAYNYIINGNYATGFFVLATMFALLGIGFIVIYYLCKMHDTQETLRSSCQSMEVGVYALQEASQDSTESSETE